MFQIFLSFACSKVPVFFLIKIIKSLQFFPLSDFFELFIFNKKVEKFYGFVELI